MALKTCEMRVLYISVIMMCQFYGILSCLSVSKCLKVLKTQYIAFFFLNTFTNLYFSLSWSVYLSILHSAAIHIECPSHTRQKPALGQVVKTIPLSSFTKLSAQNSHPKLMNISYKSLNKRPNCLGWQAKSMGIGCTNTSCENKKG